MSPIALCVVFEQMKRGRNMGIKEVMEMESKMACGFYQGEEFYEGLRGFVDRENPAEWKFKSVKEVTKKDVDFYFSHNEVFDLDLYKNL